VCGGEGSGSSSDGEETVHLSSSTTIQEKCYRWVEGESEKDCQLRSFLPEECTVEDFTENNKLFNRFLLEICMSLGPPREQKPADRDSMSGKLDKTLIKSGDKVFCSVGKRRSKKCEEWKKFLSNK
tara:strand:+ start:232 stop:609 length:378 start_codon:yes stop_codon:yes gene_type:complete